MEDTQGRWATLLEFPGYAVSDRGECVSYYRVGSGPGGFIGRRISETPRPMKAHVNPRGYVYFKMKDRRGRARNVQAHRLVLTAFVGPCPEGHEGCHRDGSRQNSELSNLYWGTRSDNCRDTTRHGRNRSSKMTQEQIDEAVELANAGVKQAELARRYGVRQCSISRLLYARGVPRCWRRRSLTDVISAEDAGRQK